MNQTEHLGKALGRLVIGITLLYVNKMPPYYEWVDHLNNELGRMLRPLLIGNE